MFCIPAVGGVPWYINIAIYLLKLDYRFLPVVGYPAYKNCSRRDPLNLGLLKWPTADFLLFWPTAKITNIGYGAALYLAIYWGFLAGLAKNPLKQILYGAEPPRLRWA